MALNISLEKMDAVTARITLVGELDASTASQFKAAIEKAAADQISRLVLMMEALDYMASAGVRVLVFARQKMGAGMDIYVVAPQESVRETLELTGMAHALYIVDSMDALQAVKA